MRSQRPGRKVFKTPGPAFGVKVIEPGFPSAAGGWWDDFGDPAIAACAWAAYQPKGAANLGASYIDLTGNGNNCGPGVAPAWNAVQGWIFAGAQWLDTGVIPGPGWSVLVQFTNAAGAVSAIFGAMVGGNRFQIQPVRFGIQVAYSAGGSLIVAPQLVTGNLGIAGQQGYRNGVADGGLIGGVTNPGVSVYLGARNNAGAADSLITADMAAFALYNCTLTAPQMLAVAGNMAVL